MLVDRLHPLTSEEGERGQSPDLEWGVAEHQRPSPWSSVTA